MHQVRSGGGGCEPLLGQSLLQNVLFVPDEGERGDGGEQVKMNFEPEGNRRSRYKGSERERRDKIREDAIATKTGQSVFKCPYPQFGSCGLHCPKFQLGDPNRCLAKEGKDK